MNRNENPTFYGLYRAQVVQSQGLKALVSVPELSGSEAIGWAMPCVTPGTSPTSPKPGDSLWVMFEHGDAMKPVWLGTWRV